MINKYMRPSTRIFIATLFIIAILFGLSELYHHIGVHFGTDEALMTSAAAIIGAIKLTSG